MPQAPSPKRAEAKSMFLASGGTEKLRSIAEKLGVSEGTLRGWKAKDRWDDDLSGTLRKKKRNAPKKKRGAPKGNKRALGHVGAKLLGEDNGNYRHGAYTGIYLDVLSDKECEIMSDLPDAEEALLVEQIRLLSVREVRLLQSIFDVKKKVKSAKDGMISISAKKSIEAEDTTSPKTYFMIRKVGEVTTTEMTKVDPITVLLKLEAALTQVQAKKTKCINSLYEIRLKREKLELVKLQMGVGDNDQLRRAEELLGGIESAF